MPSPVAVSIELTEGEREQLVSWSRRHTSAQALALRSRIVLSAAEGVSSSEIARVLGVSVATARKWRNRFAVDRLDGLVDEPRPGRPETITDQQVDDVIIKTLEATPNDATHWSTRSMAREVGLTPSAVFEIWRDVHLVLDNASTHKTPQIKRWLLAHPRFVLHFTPTSSSWINLVERWFAELTNKKLKRSAHRSVPALNKDIRAWIETWNENPQPFVWTKTADQILDSIARYCTRINQTAH